MTHEIEREDTPEDIFTVRTSLPPGLPIDAIHCVMCRTNAVINMLMAQFEEPDTGTRCTDDTILSVLWSVRGDLGLLKKLVDFAWETRSMAKKEARHG